MTAFFSRHGALALALALASASFPTFAETRYVTDELEIMLRAGNGTQYKITRMLASGTPVKVLEEADGWARVTTPRGQEGWVLSRFLSNDRSARERLEIAEKQLAELRGGGDTLQKKLVAQQAENQRLLDENHSLTTRNTELDRELNELKAATADTLAIVRSNRLLQGTMKEQASRIDSLERDNAQLRDATAQNWFLYGAGTVFGGIVLGLILPRIPRPRRRRRGSWDTL
ncbi:MAG: TIGR04211 family SH3 domain-containing protein [Zoogloeaceae bacterium]|nr:TIGR04211 family SH3 domain-containing protein [Zoogloeaceae bacterium]